MKPIALRLVTLLLAALQLAPPMAYAVATDITQLPMSTQSATATPNVIIAADDSGSMDWEIMLNTNGGELWWDPDSRAFWDGAGKLYFDPTNSAGKSRSEYVYLFPNGYGSTTTQEVRRYQDDQGGSTTHYFAVPPIAAYAFIRSSTYNPMYYNPAVEYLHWEDAYTTVPVSFADADPKKARSHPYWPTSGTATTMDLTALQSAQTANFTFRMVSGMTIPGASVTGVTGKCSPNSTVCPSANRNKWGAVTTNLAVGSGQTWDVAVPYYPATYWVVDSSCTSGVSCSTGPDGQKLRRYEIRSGVTFPSGRSYTKELQNFANWFQYYRKRKLLLAAASGTVFSQVQGIRGGATYFNASSTLSMNDFSSTNASANAKQVLGTIYLNQANGGTPTRDVLYEIGEVYRTNKNIILYACQRNSAFVITDGYADTTFGGTVPPYSQATWVGSPPYTTIYSKTLADIASAYYTVNLRPDLPLGQLSPNADKNPNLHMTTYALTLGALGTIYGTGVPADKDPFATPPSWPNPTVNYSPTAVDDLWHATINGRGQMFTTGDSTGLVTTLRQAVAAILARSGSDAAFGINNVSAGDTKYASSYDGQFWSGKLGAYHSDPTTGVFTGYPDSPVWEAGKLLTAMKPDKRLLATYDGSAGIPFRYARLPAAYQADLTSPSVTPSDASTVVDFLRGDRSLENKTFRIRSSLLGDIVNSAPLVANGAVAQYADSGYGTFADSIKGRQRIVYQGANDGMLHAFNASDGTEMWAYVPALVKNKLNALTSVTYSHQFYVDGTPTLGDVYIGASWRTMLVGGLRAGGNGYYALDVTSPNAADEAAVASKVMWEFPNAGTISYAPNIGLTFGRPVFAKTKAKGWVVLVTSGYNNSAGDGKGHLFVLDPATGSVIKDVSTGTGSSAWPSGLGQLSPYQASGQVDATVDVVYGGDLLGNLWRFDLSGASVGQWGLTRLATLVDSSGIAQPITTAPELATVHGKRLILVGTGEFLGQSDVSNTQVQSVYGIVDDMTGTPIASVRSSLVRQPMSVGTDGVRNIISNAVDLDVKRGWYIDLPGQGERLNTDPAIALGALVFVTNQPSGVACNAKSFLYALDVTNGGQLPATAFLHGEAPWAGKQIGNVLANQALIEMLTTGIINITAPLSDGTPSGSSQLNLLPPPKVNSIAWKEIFR